MTFRHGVASGDPLSDSVVLWTRSPGPTEVDWVVARDPDLLDVVAKGTAATSADADFTVHVDPGGLEPATTYWYRFSAGADLSPTGRTRTAPAPGAPVDHLRLGLVSCASYAAGWFHAYRNLARRDLDLVVHVGDYLYENGRHSGHGPRRHPPRRAVTLAGYRARHALYKSDHDLQTLHARHPMVAVWDDHELAGGAWSGGAHEHVSHRHGSWADRKAAAVQAYWEWMPLRPPEPDVPERIYRMQRWGDLADLALLDTRLIGRDEPVGRGRGVVVKLSDTGRSMLGARQRDWLAAKMAASTARWRVVGSQVVVAPIPLVAGRLLNPGQWDGYPEERDWLYGMLAADRGGGSALSGNNVAVLSGDIHSSWANELPVGAEFVGPSVSSPSFADILVPGGRLGQAASERMFRWQNRHVRMVELRHHGYVVVDLNPERIQGDWWHLDTVTGPSPDESFAGGWQLHWGRPGLEPAAAPADGPRR
ncbi:MAG: alkaline phosphatase [Actinomycetota bacterium]|nr:alkaline phosphatase [Actinomycetota bacterium]